MNDLHHRASYLEVSPCALAISFPKVGISVHPGGGGHELGMELVEEGMN